MSTTPFNCNCCGDESIYEDGLTQCYGCEEYYCEDCIIEEFQFRCVECTLDSTDEYENECCQERIR